MAFQSTGWDPDTSKAWTRAARVRNSVLLRPPAAGFRNTDISVLFPENVGTKDFARE